ncbi:cGMP-dependent protein kinase 1 [Neosynchiropus ocellatus]
MGTLRDLQYALQLKIEELRQRDALIDELELELDTKDELIRRLQEELDRYRTAASCPTSGSEVCLDHVERRPKSRRKTVQPESFSLDPEPVNESHRIIYKDQDSQRIIQAAFLKNDLLKNLEEEEMLAVISRMYPISIHQGCQVIQEGTGGAQAFVLEEGRMEVSKAGVKQLSLVPEDMFGEAALLYECTHSSSVSEHVMRERRILLEADCPFIVRSYKTFRDAECLYVLMEACLHGDLHSLLKERGFLDERSSRFYAACVAEALAFLHRERVVYRDVKPENVLLDERGYAKLTGTRCFKRVEAGKRTYSFCGTPGYIAPEVILGQGHGFAADFWSLGVLVFELLSGRLPFSGPDPIKTLSATFSGADQIDFPKEISESASCLIKQLCRLNPTERLGGGRNWAKDIHRHTWFEGFNWDGLRARTLNPPAPPQAEHLSDSTCGQYTGDAAEPDATWDDF